jgi:hypothetical protein
MTTKKESGQLEKHRFLTEKFLERIPLPYPITSVLVGVSLYLMWLAVAITSGLELSVFIKDPWFIMVSSFMAFLLGGTKYAFDDIRHLPLKIKEIFDTANFDFESFFTNRHKIVFSSRHFLIGILLSIVLLAYGYANRFYWIQREHNLAIYLIGIVYWVMICIIVGMVSWCAGWGFQFYWWIGHEAPLQLRPFKADRIGGLNPITRQHLTATFLMAIGTSFLVFVSDVAMFLMLASCIFLMLFYFFAPQYYVHLKLVKIKKEMLDEIGDRLYRKSVDFLRDLDKRVKNKEVRLDIDALEALRSSANDMREWPFDFGIVLKVIGSLVLPILAFALSVLSRL